MQRDENHPRPQLVRAQWHDLSGTWQFAYDDKNLGLKENWHGKSEVFDRTIIVPFPPESPASGINDTAFHPIVWYRRTFTVNAADRNDRLLLHFGAVDYSACVWVNGQLVAQHEGGHTPFSADITTALRADTPEQVVVVRAEDQPGDLTQPRGKQYWEEKPRRIWYHRTTGIWQPVWLEPVSDIYVEEIRWTPDIDRGMLEMNVSLNHSPTRPVQLQVRLSLEGVTLADDTYIVTGRNLHRAFTLASSEAILSREKAFWSPRYPNLIDAELKLVEADGQQTLDEVLSYAGLRSAGFSNGRFLLNGRPTYLRLVLEQGYWPESHLAAPSGEALRREVELIKQLGFNGVRIHQKVEDPRFLYWCDKLGLLVWGEMANAYVFAPEAVEKLTREWLEVVRRDYSHPCIVTWVPFNESWGLPSLETDPAQQNYVQALYHLTHALDRTRPVIGNDGWEHLAGDIWGIHDYAIDGATILQRYGTPEAVERTLREVQPHFRTIVLPQAHHHGEPIMLTECGGISYAPDAGEDWWGYVTVTDEASYIAKYNEVISAILACPTITGFCYTQLTDTGQETNGLLREDRTPKLPLETAYKITRQNASAMPGEIVNNIQVTTEISTFQQAGN